jgi:glycosyltransferase involved in cell wall biosynthesis
VLLLKVAGHEAVALAVLEAMACGVAVVLSRIRAFGQLTIGGITGRLVSVGGAKALAAGSMNAWEHCEALGWAARDTVQNLLQYAYPIFRTSSH